MRREVVFTAFHRVNYLREAVSSWNQAANILDWPMSYLLEPTSVAIEQAMLKEFSRLECAELNGVINDHRMGVLRNPHAAMISGFAAGNDFVILAEDDIIVADDVLEYFDWAMNEYKEDKSVLGILAFSRVTLDSSKKDASLVSRTKVFCPLVWGTWRDRWESLVEPNWDLDYSSGLSDGSCAGWDWNMMRVAVNEDKDFIYPQLSRSDHIGKFGGTHTLEAAFPDTQAPTFKSTHDRKSEFKEEFLADWKLDEYYPRTN